MLSDFESTSWFICGIFSPAWVGDSRWLGIPAAWSFLVYDVIPWCFTALNKAFVSRYTLWFGFILLGVTLLLKTFFIFRFPSRGIKDLLIMLLRVDSVFLPGPPPYTRSWKLDLGLANFFYCLASTEVWCTFLNFWSLLRDFEIDSTLSGEQLSSLLMAGL